MGTHLSSSITSQEFESANDGTLCLEFSELADHCNSYAPWNVVGYKEFLVNGCSRMTLMLACSICHANSLVCAFVEVEGVLFELQSLYRSRPEDLELLDILMVWYCVPINGLFLNRKLLYTVLFENTSILDFH